MNRPTKKAPLPTKDPLEKKLKELTVEQLQHLGRAGQFLADAFQKEGKHQRRKMQSYAPLSRGVKVRRN